MRRTELPLVGNDPYCSYRIIVEVTQLSSESPATVDLTSQQ